MAKNTVQSVEPNIAVRIISFVGRFQISFGKRVYIVLHIAKGSHNRSNNKINTVILTQTLFALENVVVQLNKACSNFLFSAFL